ncbi:MAG: hypothetical protein ABW224_03735 [Kibdelosporangium sp.]
MRVFGGFLIFAGFVSAILHFTDYQLRILMWSESMQPLLGIGIGVVGCVIVGASVAMQKNKEAQAVQALPPPPGYGPAQHQPSYGPQSGPMPQQQPYPPQAQQPYPPQQHQQYGQPQPGQNQYGQPQFGQHPYGQQTGSQQPGGYNQQH